MHEGRLEGVGKPLSGSSNAMPPVYLRLVRTTERHTETVTLREQQVEIARAELDASGRVAAACDVEYGRTKQP